MRLPQIRMESTYAKIELNSRKGQQEIEQPSARLSIQQPKAEMEVEKIPSRLTIDQSRARADVDLKSASQRIEEAAQQGYQDLLEGIARRAQEGEAMMKIENGGGAIAQLAKQHKVLPEHEFGLGWIPSVGSVRVDYDPGRLDIYWKVNKPIIDSQTNQPIINYYPGSVEVNMKQYQSLRIDFDNLNFIGVKYEQSI
jgi:hypothetical protein